MTAALSIFLSILLSPYTDYISGWAVGESQKQCCFSSYQRRQSYRSVTLTPHVCRVVRLRMGAATSALSISLHCLVFKDPRLLHLTSLFTR